MAEKAKFVAEVEAKLKLAKRLGLFSAGKKAKQS